MTEEQEKYGRLCVICGKEKVFRQQKSRFDKCLYCATARVNEMHDNFIASLSVEQIALFSTYEKAREEITSMLDIN